MTATPLMIGSMPIFAPIPGRSCGWAAMLVLYRNDKGGMPE